MTCIQFKGGIVCHSAYPEVDLAPYGANIWMDYHHYLGPIFFRSKNMIKPIGYPGKKTWDAFDKWYKEVYKGEPCIK